MHPAARIKLKEDSEIVVQDWDSQGEHYEGRTSVRWVSLNLPFDPVYEIEQRARSVWVARGLFNGFDQIYGCAPPLESS